MKKSELEVMALAMAQISVEKVPVKLAYAIAKNRGKIKEEMLALEAARQPLKEFEEKRIELCRELCDKDANGKPIMEEKEGMAGRAKSFKGIAGNDEFQRRLDVLKKSYKKVFDELEAIENQEADEVNFHMVDIETLPNEIQPGVLEALMPMIRDS